MPLSMSMKIQPIDSRDESTTEPPLAPAPRPPVVKSRLRRLFRIGGGDEPAVVAPLPAGDHCFEPSSVCLAKMVQNFIEENNNDKQSAKCGRNRCNCFNGGSDSSDTEADGIDAADFLKSLVACSSVNEKNVLSDTAKIVEKNSKVCKRKDDMRKAVVDALIGLGYDASVCKSKWEKSPSLPAAGEYEYVDVILVGGERLIIDVDFRSEFEIARSTKSYKLILQTLPNVFVGKSERLKKIIVVASEAVRQNLKKKGMHFPPWRKTEYFEAKWLSPHTRLLPVPSPPPPPVAASPATSPLLVGPVAESAVDVKNNLTKSTPDGNREEEEEEEEESCSSSPPGNAAQLGDANNPQFAMSECSSGEEEEEEDIDDGDKENLEI